MAANLTRPLLSVTSPTGEGLDVPWKDTREPLPPALHAAGARIHVAQRAIMATLFAAAFLIAGCRPSADDAASDSNMASPRPNIASSSPTSSRPTSPSPTSSSPNVASSSPNVASSGPNVASSRSNDAARPPGKPAASERIKAVVVDAREPFGDSTLAAIRDLGATHVSLISFGFQEGPSEPAIRFSPDVRWYSESAAGARAIAARAESFGLRLILKPQLWLRGGEWTANINFDTEDDWQLWESDYRSYLLHTAQLASEIQADVLVVATELSKPVRQRPEFWRSLIAEVREIYDGELTYAANWHDDFEHVSFWDDLDYIGVNAYFPLSSDPRPGLDELRRGWARHTAALEKLAQREDRPVLFTELGYRSVAYAAAEPWRWPSRDEVGSVQPDYQLQSDLFRAFFDAVWPAPWFAGAIIWKMYPYGHRRHGTDRIALDFTPQGKPAEHTIRDAFGSLK